MSTLLAAIRTASVLSSSKLLIKLTEFLETAKLNWYIAIEIVLEGVQLVQLLQSPETTREETRQLVLVQEHSFKILQVAY